MLTPYENENFNYSEYTFMDSKSYDKPEPEEEEPEDIRPITEKAEGFIRDTSFKASFKKWLILFLVLTYIVWVSAQYLTSLTHDITVSIIPHRVVYNLLSTNPALAGTTAFLMAIFALVIIYAFTHKTKQNEELYKLSQNSTFGSAKFASDEDMRGAIVFNRLGCPRGIVLGYNENVNIEPKPGAVDIMSEEAYQDMKKEVSVCVDSKILSRNLNFIVFGSSGAGKSYSFSRPNILTRIANGDSFFVSDPSGELYRDTAALAEAHGYDVKVLNLITPNTSNGWNPFDTLRSADPMEVQTLTASLVHTILTNTEDENAKTEVFFNQSEENLLKALILYVAISPHFKGEEYERHMGTVYDLLTKLAAQEGILEEFAPQNLPETDPASAPWKIFQGAGRLKTNFITGLASRLEIFQIDIIKEMFSHSEIDLSAAGQKKCAYYIMSSITNDKMRFLLSLFFSCAFEQLINDATASGGKTKIPVYFILDEFKGIGRINNFEKKLANVRKYGISISMIFQDLNQLEQLYPHDFVSILSNSDTWVALRVNDMETAQKLSERSGVATIEVTQSSIKKMKLAPIDPVDPMVGLKIGDQKRNLLNPDEIMRYFDDEGTNNRKVLIFANGKNPYKAKAYGWPLHDLAKGQLVQREISEFIPPWQKGEWTINKKRTFMTTDVNNSSDLYGGKALEPDPYKEKARNRIREEDTRSQIRPETNAKEVAKKKKGGVVFNSNAESTHLVELGLDLSGKKKV